MAALARREFTKLKGAPVAVPVAVRRPGGPAPLALPGAATVTLNAACAESQPPARDSHSEVQTLLLWNLKPASEALSDDSADTTDSPRGSLALAGGSAL